MTEDYIDIFKKWMARALFAFVLLTIGFSLGRQTAPRAPATPPAPPAAELGESKIVVYCTHMTFRCATCNQIEWFTRELLDTEFAAELASGKIEFQSVDYTQNPEFAKQYDIASSTVVISCIEDGREKSFQRLDDVWTKVNNKPAFMDYVRQAIRQKL